MNKEFDDFCDNIQKIDKKLAEICAPYLHELILDGGIHSAEKASGVVSFLARTVAVIIARNSIKKHRGENISEMIELFQNLVPFYMEQHLSELEECSCACS